ncbi:MAG TPA: beta-ketoacyl synthase N-terminal-like domain-containing protein [Pseudonocardiaceae bacterium]|jgi:minimal PKS chain-length factor (CLF/KS beta)|nr:beta-ketoacyl synthase N-terminal-like domain-containing protein [Pseudonocardiaceae bacterium]
MSPRAVVTGVGVIAPSGLDAAAHWKTVTSGTNRLGRISLFDPSRYETTIAGEVTDFEISGQLDGRLVVQTDRWTWMGLLSARQAIADAGLADTEIDPYELSVSLASSSGGNQFGQKELQRLWSLPDRTVGAYQSIAWFYAATVGQVSIHNQAKGPCNVLAAESAGGLDSIAHAARLIRRGAPMVLAGGLEAPLSPYALACQQRNGWLSVAAQPERAYLPFDTDAAGYVPGEGGAVLLVEDLDHALARNAPVIYGEVLGWASTHDGEPTKRGGSGSVRHYAASMRTALSRAGVSPDEVDVVIPDALGVPGYDAAEAQALHEVFGESGPSAVTSQKSLVGRMYQGGSALDVVTALLAMREQVLPASTGQANPAPGCALNFVAETRPAEVNVALIGARGYDGFNSSLVIGRYDADHAESGVALQEAG